MKSSIFINKIKKYSLISFIIPLIAINSCFLLFKFLGDHEIYKFVSYESLEKEEVYSLNGFFLKKHDNKRRLSFINCPKYAVKYSFITEDKNRLSEVNNNGVIVKIKNNSFTINDKSNPDVYIDPHQSLKKLNIRSIAVSADKTKINYKCAKNNIIFYTLIKYIPKLDSVLVDKKINYSSGFGIVKNPYFYGEVSISRTARYFPANLIFKPLIILSSFFLLLYWRSNFYLFSELKNKNIINHSPKNFLYLGSLSCLFLTLHAIFLGVDFDSKLFAILRKLIIILFILFEILAQIYLTKYLYKYKNNLKNYIKPLIINIKIIFVSVVLFSTIIAFSLLIWGDMSTSVKHILEWNYFSILLIYYLLSRLLWKSSQT